MHVFHRLLLPIEIADGVAPYHLPRLVQLGAHPPSRARRCQIAANFAHPGEGLLDAHLRG